MGVLRDPFGRRVDYLRLSITDRCNLRCVYCLPERGYSGSPAAELLSDAEILRLCRIAAGLGVRRVRVTGGEPLTRPGIEGLIAGLARIDGLDDISLSTNGMLLASRAAVLARAGLRRVNVSLDTLQPERFREVTRRGRLADVRAGIETALACLDPVKINVVVVRGLNDSEIPAFAALTEDRPLHVRFIELMPIGETGFFTRDRRLPLAEIMARCGALEPAALDEAPRGYGPAVYYRRSGSRGTVGFISALSCNFCGRCNRLRLTARGRLVPCLASESGLDLRGPLRSGAADGELAALFEAVVAAKPERHSMDPAGEKVRESFMCSLGG